MAQMTAETVINTELTNSEFRGDYRHTAPRNWRVITNTTFCTKPNDEISVKSSAAVCYNAAPYSKHTLLRWDHRAGFTGTQ